MPIYPISFSIPEEDIVNDIPNKTKFQSNLIPGDLSTYIYENKETYNNEYKNSLFAFTYKKGGWDCARHYEILSNGCIPYFPTIEECPTNTMFLLPRGLIKEGNKLYEDINNKINKKIVNLDNIVNFSDMKKKWKIKDSHTHIFEIIYKNINVNINEIDEDDIQKCKILIKKLIEYTKTNLSTKAIANYVLNVTNNLNASSILYLSRDNKPDYLNNLTLHGFKNLLGKECYDCPKMSCIYENGNIKTRTTTLYTLQNLLNNEQHKDIGNIEENIKNHKYSLIIYGSYTRGMPYFDLVTKFYKSENIILFDGEDSARHVNEKIKNCFVFVREKK